MEIDALGGVMGRIADASAIQFKMLNRSKGPAVWSPRSQNDREGYSIEARRVVESTPGLEVIQGSVSLLHIEDDSFDYSVNEKKVAEEAALDGIYIVRTSLPLERMSPEDAVRNYKSLANVERAFRSMKTVDLLVRPIRHRTEERVRAHIFLCMLSYYVLWHMIQAWRPLTFADEDQDAKSTRDPVAPAKRSAEALAKAATKKTDDDDPVQSFRTLLDHLG